MCSRSMKKKRSEAGKILVERGARNKTGRVGAAKPP